MVAKPDMIIIPDEASAHPQPDPGWQKWQHIPAVKEKRIIHVNGDVHA